MVEELHSGAQTGADQAGLDAALALGLRAGGWVPKGRRTDAGPLSDEQMRRWGLKEHPSPAYPPRTEQNVRGADVTVWFGNTGSPGYYCTLKATKRWGKPFHVNPDAFKIQYLASVYRVWNIAGNRERTNVGIYQSTFDALVGALSSLLRSEGEAK